MPLQPDSSADVKAPSAPAPDGAPGPRRVASHEILSGDREVIVEHRGNDYRLKLTANGKLILTK